MDTSETRIKMCKKAVEIQRGWKPQVGDYVWRKYTVFGEELDSQIWSKDKKCEVILLTYASDVDGYFHATKDGETRIFNSHNEMHKSTCIWLPTQDQLQEMVRINLETNIYTLHTFFNEFIERYYGHNIYPCDIFTSMGQLWLAFVMKQNHGKIWNGEDWVKEE